MEPPLTWQAGCSEEPITTAPAQDTGPPNQPAPLLSEQPPSRKMMLYYFKIIGVFPTSKRKQLFLNIDLSRANTPWVKSSIGALWYGDQFHCWVKRFININSGTFAYVTHRHNLPSENQEQNPYNSSVCHFLIFGYKMTTEVTWARRVYQAKSQTPKAFC